MQTKVALITGGTRGIGLAIAEQLIRENFCVSVTASSDLSENLKEKFSREKMEFFRADVSREEECAKVVDQVLQRFGQIDVLVNCAGITRDGLLLSMKKEDFERVLSVNLTGTFHMIKSCLKSMIKCRAGKIVNIASVVGLSGNAGQANYAASKAGIIGLTKSVAKEYASRGITCNAVAPGFIETDMTKQMSAEARERALLEIPLKRYGTPEDVANAVSFLVSERADYITGEVLKVDGGMYI